MQNKVAAATDEKDGLPTDFYANQSVVDFDTLPGGCSASLFDGRHHIPVAHEKGNRIRISLK